MLNRILDFFVIPSSSAEETHLVGRWLSHIFVFAFGILFIYAVVAINLKLNIDTLSFTGLFLVLLAGLFVLLKKGHVRLASLLFYLSAVLGMSFAAFRFGGVRSASYNALIIVIIISALFLRGRITILTTTISAVFGLFLMMAEFDKTYLPDQVFLGLFDSWISSVMTFVLAAILLGIAARQIRAAMRRVTQEMNERQHAENLLREKSHYQAALHETALGIINRMEILPLLESILTRAEILANTQHGYIDMLMPDGQNLQQIIGHGIFTQFIGTIVRPGEGLSGEVLSTAATRMVENNTVWREHIPKYIEADFKAIAAVPLISNGQIVGILGLAHTTSLEKFSEAQLEILDQFAELAALAMENATLYQASQAELVERKRAQEALSRSEENLHQALDAANMGTWEWDLGSETVYWSKNVYKIFGVNPEDFQGSFENYLSLVHPSDRQKLTSQLENSVLYPEQGYLAEHRILWQGKTVRWLEGKGKVRLDETGKPTSMSGTITDITERKTAEQNLRKANQRLKKDALVLERRSALLHVAAQVSRAASATLDPDLLDQEVVDLVRKRFNLYFVGLFLINEDGTCAQLRAATGKAGRLMLASNYHLEVAATSMVGWCIANRQARIALDVGEEALRLSNPLLPLTRSELALPLISRGQVLGAINVQSKRETAFSPEDIETFQTLSDQLANALLNARLYNQLQLELEERIQADDAVRLLNSELETRVHLRTMDLQASEEKFRALSENNPLQITRYDREGHYLYTNRVGRNDLLKPKDISGKKLRDVLAADSSLVEYAEACIRQVFETGKPLNTEFAQDDYYALWSLAPEFGPNGEVLSVITSAMDITERKRIEEELHERSLELQASNRELEAFSYSVSHDLRAPLRAIDGFSRILLDDYAEHLHTDTSHYLQRISEAARQMGRLIDDILRLSRITRSELHTSQVDLSALADSILTELLSREPERKLKIEIQSGLIVAGDERLLRVALENLLSNALKFTSKVENAQIRVGAQRDGMEKNFFISDNGVGFDMEYADKLFGAFQRLHNNDEFPGTGIGLAIVQRVINKHGGRIWGTAEKGKGATFYFSL